MLTLLISFIVWHSKAMKPRYEVVEQFDAIEIRYYPPVMKVKVESVFFFFEQCGQ